ncbi:hypothetical protein UP10_36310 [Bradyrhizobium sp. LTSPM299]|nr:hypothetical protein UP10_36310 [Bradyrhizobium sp. LTSPM299]
MISWTRLIGQAGVPVIDAIDTKQLDSLAYIGCRTFLTGMDCNTKTFIAADTEEIHEFGRAIANLAPPIPIPRILSDHGIICSRSNIASASVRWR